MTHAPDIKVAGHAPQLRDKQVAAALIKHGHLGGMQLLGSVGDQVPAVGRERRVSLQ